MEWPLEKQLLDNTYYKDLNAEPQQLCGYFYFASYLFLCDGCTCGRHQKLLRKIGGISRGNSSGVKSQRTLSQQTWAASSSNIYNFPVFPPEMRYFSRSELAIVLLQFYLPSKLFDLRWENKFIQTNLIIPVCVLASFTLLERANFKC